MNLSDDNPAGNVLPNGVSEESLAKAIARSGYPLQSVIAKQLTRAFYVIEEWSYSDRETGKSRALDIFAFRRLTDDEFAGPVRGSIALLVECKRSTLPWVFFRAGVPRLPDDFPQVGGLGGGVFQVHSADRQRVIEMPAYVLLDFREDAFVTHPPVCTGITRVMRKGKELELSTGETVIEVSGDDVFNSVMLPLGKAMDFAAEFYRPKAQGGPLYPVLTLAVCVLEAPMVVAGGEPDGEAPVLVPWVRVVRQEATAAAVPPNRTDGRPNGDSPERRHYVVDVVHRDFVDSYVADWVLPFATRFTAHLERAGPLLAKRRGTIDELVALGQKYIIYGP